MGAGARDNAPHVVTFPESTAQNSTGLKLELGLLGQYEGRFARLRASVAPWRLSSMGSF